MSSHIQITYVHWYTGFTVNRRWNRVCYNGERLPVPELFHHQLEEEWHWALL